MYQQWEGEDLGIDLVLDQGFDGAEQNCWHLHQDLVIALGLLREGDTWVCPREGYTEVAQLKRDSLGAPVLLEVRAEHLRDYLAARKMALRVATYRSRRAIVQDASGIPWQPQGLVEAQGGDTFEARVEAIHEGGLPFGSTAAVFHVGRTDVDAEDDVPVFDFADDTNTRGSSWTVQSQGRKVFDVVGELWRTEWVEPASASPRVRGDKVPSKCSFIVDSSGASLSADELEDENISRWLWFRPGVVEELAQRRGGSLNWYTRNTGRVGPLRGCTVHLGVNGKALINVYARDIARLPEWLRFVWMGFSIAPDGKVSEELLDAQMRAEPAPTYAPEARFANALVQLDTASSSRWRAPLFRQHPKRPDILRSVHRFRALKSEGLLALAKDIARLTVDSIDVDHLARFVPPGKFDKRSTIKFLESALATLAPPEEARRLTGPLVGVYELRLGDAHLPRSDIENSFTLAGIDSTASPVQQAMQMIDTTATALESMAATVATAKP